MSATAIPCRWDGDSFTPLGPRWARQADKEFVVGEAYRIEAVQERSAASHRHYFACIADAWANLREDLADRFATAEHLRKYALIRTGYHDERSIVCRSEQDAERVAAFVKPMDTYAVVIVCDAVVKVFTAKSQSLKAMGRREFADSKIAVLDFVAGLVGVKADELARAAEAA